MYNIIITIRATKAIAMVLVVVFMTGCDLIGKIKNFFEAGIPDTTEKVVGVMDHAISSLNVISADWQDVLQKAINDLPKEVQSTVTNEVSNLMNRTVSAAGAEARCNVDFFRTRVQQGLQQIKARYLGTEVPPLEPHLCNVVPLAIDMSLPQDRRNKLEYYGYDFDKSAVKVVHVQGSKETDVTYCLDQPTHYHMTLNLGSTGVACNSSSERIVLRWNNRNISSIAIVQPAMPICETTYDNFLPAKISYMPPLTSGGDTEFNGNGPDCFCSVNLINKETHIEANVYFRARETKSNWTTASGTKIVNIYTADPNKTIEAIVGATSASYSYIDTNHALDAFPGSGPVGKFTFMGDGPGDDVGRHTRVEITFNPIRVQLKEKSNCVASGTLRSLELSGNISNTLQREIDIRRPTMNFIAPQELGPISRNIP